MAGFSGCKRRLGALGQRCWTWGWQGAAVGLLGALAALGFRPLALWPAMMLGVAALVWLVCRARTWREAGLIGWVWGVGHFSAGNSWIATAFTYQAKMPAALGGIAVVLLSLYLALFPALAAVGAWGLRRDARALVPGFAGCWIISEWLRSWLFTGFAWNPLGVALLGDEAHAGLAALTPWIGTYGLSGLAALLAALVALGGRALVDGEWRPGIALVAAPMVLVGVAMVWPGAGPQAQGHIAYTLIQPNIAQSDLDDPAHFEAQFEQSALLSWPRHADEHRLLLWPESGVPDYMRDGYPAWYYESTFAGDPDLARMRLGRVAGARGVLLTGSVDLDIKGQEAVGGQNVVTALDGQGRIVGSYAKAHLVPYGEYLPMRSILKPLGLARLVPGEIDFRAGPGPRTIDLGDLGKAGIQICYEIIFSGQVVDRDHRPDYIVNPSNDGWFGAWGPPQHLAQARLRAIEEGLPVLRSTTNGVSAVVDADGLVRHWAPRGVAARFDGMVPPAHAPTLFARAGNIVPLGLALVLLVASALVLWRRRV
ncbi:MAG: apolipoprotein N-acyltransferase [Sphingomonadales bacterium]|nr:apolipoprotein N-acyltransferase [Sphingomonadales bacterium]MDE2168977.1 apolipoprotein N-acyltransferase [Sphingomonadales bacterium]